MAVVLYSTLTALGAIAALLYAPLKHQATVLGFTRPLDSWENVHGVENRAILNTVACEDLHYHELSGMLYSACMKDIEKASGWYPGAGSLDHPENPSYGTFVVIDPKTMESQELVLSGFEGPFVTHGISLYSTPSDPQTVYIFAVNHVPNPLWTATSSKQPKAASRIELFVHTTGSKTAKHLRSISHPLIRAPNDLLALSEDEFLVTNDHYYREPCFMRLVEQATNKITRWTDTTHVRLGDDGAVDATISTTAVPINNGLGWGPDRQVLLSDAIGGNIYFAEPPTAGNTSISVTHSARSDGLVDNPSFFSDPYAGLDGKDYSGYLLPGFGRALGFPENFKDPTGKAPLTSMVHYLPASAGRKNDGAKKKQARLLFSDDGSSMRAATTAVITAIDPATNEGRRQGWLFVTGVVAPHMLATRIDFESALA